LNCADTCDVIDGHSEVRQKSAGFLLWYSTILLSILPLYPIEPIWDILAICASSSTVLYKERKAPLFPLLPRHVVRLETPTPLDQCPPNLYTQDTHVQHLYFDFRHDLRASTLYESRAALRWILFSDTILSPRLSDWRMRLM
jgi:hypothetical protein